MPTPYFANFPQLGYCIDGSGEKTLVVDILQRAKIRDVLASDYLIWYTYSVRDGETPEMIANKLYGATYYHWIVLFANNIVDPYYDWPMSYDNLIATIHKQYDAPGVDGLIYSYQTVDHYEDAFGNVIDQTTYIGLPQAERKVVYIYGQIIAENEAKRTIQLLDKSFVDQIATEFKAIMKQALA